ncbi:MAG TPA: hypothetical protein PLK67_08765, partial [Bryobacteraceae bacterium]|nr:hypothetical protein [Bryobacteraceae bacterium]
MRKIQLTMVPVLLSAGLLLAQAPRQESMGQQQPYGGQMRQGMPASNQTQPVQVSVPFGAVDGRLVTSGDDLIFIDDQQPQNSFVIRRDQVQNIRYDGAKVSMTLSRPVHDSSGERSSVDFRFQNPAAASIITSWLGSSSAASRPAQTGYQAQAQAQPQTQAQPQPQVQAQQAQPHPQPQAVRAPAVSNGSLSQSTVTSTEPQTLVFDVERDRFIGSDTGRLFLTPNEIIFQSLSNPGASRRWSMASIQRVERRDPFHLRVRPFVGNQFNFRILSGTGLSTPEYTALVERVNRAHMQNS